MHSKKNFPITIFTVLYAMGLLIYMLKSIVGVSFPYLKLQFGFTSLELSYIAAIYFWTYSCSFLVLGLLTRKIGVKNHAILTYLGMGICELLIAGSNTFQQFFWVKAVEGIVAAGFFLCSATLVASLFSAETKKQAQTYQISSIGIAGLLIAGLLVPLMNHFSWRVGYLGTGIFSLFIAGLIYQGKRILIHCE